MDAISIELSRFHTRHKNVPIVIGPIANGIELDGLGRSGIVFSLE
jgi:hypothetical protein